MDEGLFERRMAAVIDRLTRAGYSESFRGEPGGVRALNSGHVHQPEDLVVEWIERFEGVSNPADEAMVMAIRCPGDGCRGTYTVPYGKSMATVDSELIARIPDLRSR